MRFPHAAPEKAWDGSDRARSAAHPQSLHARARHLPRERARRV